MNQLDPVVAIIPARGGSKGIPHKNIKDLVGLPLIAHTINLAKRSNLFTKIVVSSDSNTINDIARLYGADIVERPDQLSQDHSLVSDAVEYTLQQLLYSTENSRESLKSFALLEPTSPLRTVDVLSRCLSRLSVETIQSVATVSETDVPASRLWYLEENETRLVPVCPDSDPWQPRQSHRSSFKLNGLFYGSKISWFMNRQNKNSLISTDFFPVITDPSISVDIDTIDDFNYIEFMLNKAS